MLRSESVEISHNYVTGKDLHLTCTLPLVSRHLRDRDIQLQFSNGFIGI
ncbi:hypothetical protein [Enterococcus phage PEF1]